MARIITDRDRDNANRLRAIWTRKKKELGLTQAQLAALMGFANQAVISQYLNCYIALNTDVVVRFSKHLQVTPGEIDPDLGAFTLLKDAPRTVRIPVLANISGSKPGNLETVEIATKMQKQLYAVSVDTDGFEPFAEQGATLIVSPGEEPISGDKVFIRHVNSAGAAMHMIKVYVTTDHARKVVVVHDLHSKDNHELSLDGLEALDPIVGVERPVVSRPTRLHARQAQFG